jgi:cyanophycinase
MTSGPLALVGGGEWRDGCRDLDTELLATSGAKEVVVVPAAAAFEHPDKVGLRAGEYFESLGVKCRVLPVLHRAEADDGRIAESVRRAKFVYLCDGSPLHLRSVLKDSALWDALLAAYHGGAALAASGAGATLVGDPMVDPRGGAYTVGLGLVPNLAVFPYHGTAADHMRERSIDLLPAAAKLVGIDEETALVRDPDGGWRVAGAGVVSLYEGRSTRQFASGTKVDVLG